MKSHKPQSLTTDTCTSPSHFYNTDMLSNKNKTNISQQNNSTLSRNFTYSDSREIDFLKSKNDQLQQHIGRLTDKIRELQQTNLSLLKINESYVKVVNQYYRDLQSDSKAFKSQNNEKHHVNPKNHGSGTKKNMDQSHMNSKRASSAPKTLLNSFDQTLQKTVLTQLSKDHRNLTKHCLVMQQQIKNYCLQMQRFNEMKSQLKEVNHTSPKELIQELQQSTVQNKQLKRENNRLSFELQKAKSELQRLKKQQTLRNKDLAVNGDQLEKLRAQIRKTIQQSNDKANQYEQRIYELDLKVQKLEKQLREVQHQGTKAQEKRNNLIIQRIEDVHENTFLKTSLTDLLDPRKHLMFSANRSFLHQKKSRSKSINSHLFNSSILQ